jgi:hypothetical protein
VIHHGTPPEVPILENALNWTCGENCGKGSTPSAEKNHEITRSLFSGKKRDRVPLPDRTSLGSDIVLFATGAGTGSPSQPEIIIEIIE